MPFSKALGDRERDRFVETDDNETAVRTIEQNTLAKDGQGDVLTTDKLVLMTLKDVLTELKIMNIHLANISDLELNVGDELK